MDELIARALSGNLEPSEAVKLQKWRDMSDANERRYREFERLWELEMPAAVAGQQPLRPEVAAIMGEAERRRRTVPPMSRLPQQRERRWLRRTGTAVAVAAALLLGLALPDLLDRVAPGDALQGTEVLAAGAGAATFVLSDGTVIRLAPHSRVALAPESAGRGVRLQGRAFFSVASDSLSPFTITTRAGEAVVLGTRFELMSEGDDLRLVVLDGRVGLGAGRDRIEVGANEVSHIVDGAAPTLQRVPDARALLDWPDGLLVFRATPFAEVARELERTFGVRFEAMERPLADRTVSGWFAEETFEEVLTAVCRATATRCSVDGTHVVVTDRRR